MYLSHISKLLIQRLKYQNEVYELNIIIPWQFSNIHFDLQKGHFVDPLIKRSKPQCWPKKQS